MTITVPKSSATDRDFDSKAPAWPRVESVDMLRGLVIILMTLDHVRDYFMNGRIDPTDLSQTSVALFFTRWVTHFCAPTFFFLAGIGAAFHGGRCETRSELARYLLTRGLWLVFLEETWGSFSFYFCFPKVIMAVILWALGWSMVALSALIYLPRAIVGTIGLTMIVGHNFLDSVHVEEPAWLAVAWRVLHERAFIPLPGGFLFMVLYPLVPWIGVMASGYAFAPVFRLPDAQRRRILMAAGLGGTAAFVVLRATNVYGNPVPWSYQTTTAFTLLSFLNCEKYPPSLLYLLMTLGPGVLMLLAFDRGAGGIGRVLRTYGRVPLFYYLIHWPLIHGLAVVVAAARGEPTAWLFAFPPFRSPESYGLPLGWVYAVWIGVVAFLYWPSVWFGKVKRNHRDWTWLSYL